MAAVVFLTPAVIAQDKPQITVGSKNFNESYILAEIMSQLIEREGFAVTRKFGLGGTLVCYQALLAGELDLYVEYTGTLARVILKQDKLPPPEQLTEVLAKQGLAVLPSFGFNNTYVLAMNSSLARERKVSRISDLSAHLDLKFGFNLEFLNREDGWLGLKKAYTLGQSVIGIEHGLAYQALNEGAINITDAYSTDGDIERYGLLLLEDDRDFFPEYFAVPLIQQDLPQRARDALQPLIGAIDDATMRGLNSQVVVHKLSFSEVAADFIHSIGVGNSQGRVKRSAEADSIWDRLWVNSLTHLKLTSIALLLGCLVGLPLAFLVYGSRSISRVLIYVTGLLQTIPSIALLALMIPLFGIGQIPAIIALFLYSLLPILRGTVTALSAIDPLLKDIAAAVGMNRFQQLRHVYIPLAFPNILSGIKTAAIISIGTATLAAFIGAGGLGEPIVTGLTLNDTSLILQGAIPAAILAIVVELMFDGLEKVVVKPHMLGRYTES